MPVTAVSSKWNRTVKCIRPRRASIEGGTFPLVKKCGDGILITWSLSPQWNHGCQLTTVLLVGLESSSCRGDENRW
jgi:hypothetical protein